MSYHVSYFKFKTIYGVNCEIYNLSCVMKNHPCKILHTISPIPQIAYFFSGADKEVRMYKSVGVRFADFI